MEASAASPAADAALMVMESRHAITTKKLTLLIRPPPIIIDGHCRLCLRQALVADAPLD
jgi:hypothetical protein